MLRQEMPGLFPNYFHFEKSNKKINFILLHIKVPFFLKTSFMSDFMKNVHSSHLHLKVKKAYPD